MVGSESGFNCLNPWSQPALCQQSRLLLLVLELRREVSWLLCTSEYQSVKAVIPDSKLMVVSSHAHFFMVNVSHPPLGTPGMMTQHIPKNHFF